MLSLIVPVYRNESSISELLEALVGLDRRLEGGLEAVFVVDGSPDSSFEVLAAKLPETGLRSQLVALSRNFGSFQAIRAGLGIARGDYFAVMAADLQEPIELIAQFHERLRSGSCDVVVGVRERRGDPLIAKLASALFWCLYRLLVQREVPRGGVDVFGCTRQFRDALISLPELNSTLIGLVFWLGYRRESVPYHRRARRHGTSAWSLARRVRYLLDSAFAFSDLPIRLLTLAGVLGIIAALAEAIAVVVAKVAGKIPVPGYAATIVVVTFFGGLNSLGLGIIGEYLWRTFENTKGRPPFVVAARREFPGGEEAHG